jgi:hypothetical protein
VLVPVFRQENRVHYWWVSLIIIGAILLAAPLYIYMCPSGLSDKDRIDVFTRKDDKAVYASVPASEPNAPYTQPMAPYTQPVVAHEEVSVVEMTEPGANKV